MRRIKALDEALSVLELTSVENIDELKRQRNRLVSKWHPDLFMDNEQERARATIKTQLINAAYEFLKAYYEDWGPIEASQCSQKNVECDFNSDDVIFNAAPGVFNEAFVFETFHLYIKELEKLLDIIFENKNDDNSFEYIINYPEDEFNPFAFALKDEIVFTYDYLGGDRYILQPVPVCKKNGERFVGCLCDENVYNDLIIRLEKYGLIKIEKALVHSLKPARIRLLCNIVDVAKLNIKTFEEIKQTLREEFVLASIMHHYYYDDKKPFENILGNPEEEDLKRLLGERINTSVPETLSLRYYWSTRLRKYNGYLNFVKFDLSQTEIDEAFQIALNLDDILHSPQVADWIATNDSVEYYFKKTRWFSLYTKIETTKTQKGQIIVKTYFVRNDSDVGVFENVNLIGGGKLT